MGFQLRNVPRHRGDRDAHPVGGTREAAGLEPVAVQVVPLEREVLRCDRYSLG